MRANKFFSRIHQRDLGLVFSVDNPKENFQRWIPKWFWSWCEENPLAVSAFRYVERNRGSGKKKNWSVNKKIIYWEGPLLFVVNISKEALKNKYAVVQICKEWNIVEVALPMSVDKSDDSIIGLAEEIVINVSEKRKMNNYKKIVKRTLATTPIVFWSWLRKMIS